MTQRRWTMLLVTSLSVIALISLYAGSYLILRQTTVFAPEGGVGVYGVRFAYPGAYRIFAVHEEGTADLYQANLEATGRETHNWQYRPTWHFRTQKTLGVLWWQFLPLERIELRCMGLHPVNLTHEKLDWYMDYRRRARSRTS